MSAVDLDDVSRCPLGALCESCGEGDDLAVETVRLGSLGVGCLTLCVRCRRSSTAPPVSVGTAARLVVQHAGHLGLTADEMAAAIRGE